MTGGSPARSGAASDSSIAQAKLVSFACAIEGTRRGPPRGGQAARRRHRPHGKLLLDCGTLDGRQGR